MPTAICAFSLMSFAASATASAHRALLACSGDHAWQIMRDVDIEGYWSAFWVLILLLPTLYLLARSGHPALALLHLPLLLFHPSWTTSAYHGDCGQFKSDTSTLFIYLAAFSLLESICIAIYWRKPWPWRFHWKTITPGHCTKCGYDLRATSNPGGQLLTQCPECGKPTAYTPTV